MKARITVGVALAAGLIAGWYWGHQQARSAAPELVEQMLRLTESYDAATAVRNVRVIELIDAGETQQAIAMLCPPIAHYYYVYEIAGPAAEQRAKVRGAIATLVATNKIVAERLTNHVDSGGK